MLFSDVLVELRPGGVLLRVVPNPGHVYARYTEHGQLQ